MRLGDLDVLDRAGRFEVAKVGVQRRRALGLDEQGAVRALEARQVADVDRVRDEERLGEAGGEAGEAGHHVSPLVQEAEGLAVTVEALADDAQATEPAEHRVATPFLALVDVGQVHLDERYLEGLERIVDRPRVMRPGSRVDDQAVGGAERLMEKADVLALVVRLAAPHLQVELAGPGVDLRLEILDRLAAVDRLVAPAEQVEVDPVEDVDAHAATLAAG